MIFKNQAFITSTPHTYHNEVIFVPVEQIMQPDIVPTLISRRTDQEIRNSSELEIALATVDDRLNIVYFVEGEGYDSPHA